MTYLAHQDLIPGIYKLCNTTVSHGVFDLCISFCLLNGKEKKRKRKTKCTWRFSIRELQYSRGFINVFNRRATGLQWWANLLELNSFIWKTFLQMIKPGKQNHPHSWSICKCLALKWNPWLHCINVRVLYSQSVSALP